jgi:hypothetical protein
MMHNTLHAQKKVNVTFTFDLTRRPFSVSAKFSNPL